MTRPTEGKERKVVTAFSLNPDVLDGIEEIAHREFKSKSKLVENILEMYVKAHAEGNPNFKLEQFGNGFKAYPAIWDDAYVKSLPEYSQEELEEMKQRAQKLIERVDSLIASPPRLNEYREQLGKVLKKMRHIEDILKNMDRNLGDPKRISGMHPDYVRKMYNEMKEFQAQYETLNKERAELTEKISGKKVEVNVGN